MLGGDTFDAWSYVNGVSHYNPTFTIVGPPDMAAKLLAMPNGTRVAMEGILDPRARNLMLDAAPCTSVDVVVSGRKADEALDAIAVLFEDGFGEEC